MQWTKRRKAAEEIQGSKVGIEACGIFGIVKARDAVVQKRRGSYRGVLFLQDNASVRTARVSRHPEGHGLLKLTTTLQPRSSSQRLFFPI
ncbi:hypothetical protein EVAR_74491_1 [Eumeta japonica]|uniref:Uncharacterized protein n=1 Tax=Eumeta variegata TaxID=151549 RepID=A0A4C1TEL5_EUMVA|nr:hypothetical protein EVAR_74491_1 [Eumeta japonica]